MKTIIPSLLKVPANRSSFLLVRHGQTDWNVAKKLQGHMDIPLNETGKEEARSLGAFLLDHPFDLCLSSDLMRAHQTASYLTNLDIQTDSRLRERSFGKLEGTLHKLFDESSPEAETHLNILTRIYGCLKETANSHPGKQVLVTTHGGVLKSILIDLLPLQCTRDKLQVANMATIHLTYSGSHWQLENYTGFTIP